MNNVQENQLKMLTIIIILITMMVMIIIIVIIQIQGKEYIALLSLDGTLAIFEQESHSFSRCHHTHHSLIITREMLISTLLILVALGEHSNQNYGII